MVHLGFVGLQVENAVESSFVLAVLFVCASASFVHEITQENDAIGFDVVQGCPKGLCQVP